MNGKHKRVVATLPEDILGTLDRIAAGPRFAGNRSRALAWCVGIASEVLEHRQVQERLFETPASLLEDYLEYKRQRVRRR